MSIKETLPRYRLAPLGGWRVYKRVAGIDQNQWPDYVGLRNASYDEMVPGTGASDGALRGMPWGYLD